MLVISIYFHHVSHLKGWEELNKNSYCCSRVIRPWIGLKMIELNKMIIAQLKERDPMFPDVERGILVPTVSIHPSSRSN